VPANSGTLHFAEPERIRSYAFYADWQDRETTKRLEEKLTGNVSENAAVGKTDFQAAGEY